MRCSSNLVVLEKQIIYLLNCKTTKMQNLLNSIESIDGDPELTLDECFIRCFIGGF